MIPSTSTDRKPDSVPAPSRVFLLSFLCAVLFAGFLSGQEKTGFPYLINWEPVSGAGGYIVEVQSPQGLPVQSLEFPPAVHETELRLDAGTYRFRIVTLNNLKRPDSETPWYDFTVLAYAAPVIAGTPPKSAFFGERASLTVTIRGLAVGADAWLTSPAGKRMALKISKEPRNAFTLTGSRLEERGKWSLSVRNPPDLIAHAPDFLTVEYPSPILTSVKPEAWTVGSEPESLAVRGSLFSPELQAMLKPTFEGAEPIPLERQGTPSEAAAEFTLPEEIPPGEWILAVANAPDLVYRDVQKIEVAPAPPPPVGESERQEPLPSPEPALSAEPVEGPQSPPAKPKPPKTVRGWLALGTGADAHLVGGDWSTVYGPWAAGASFTANWVFSADPVPRKGVKAAFHFGFRGEYDYRANDGASVFIKSAMNRITLLAAPGISFTWPLFRIGAWAGAGAAYTELTGEPPSGENFTHTSFDPAFAFGGSAAWLPFKLLSIGAGTRYYQAQGTPPLSTLSASLFLELAIPVSW